MRTRTGILLAVLSSGLAWTADNSSTGVDKLKDLGIADLLNVKAVTAVRHDQLQLDSPRSMSVITGSELRRRNFRTVPEALNELVGILVQETNYGGGAPIIRGMVGNRILILVDGVRLNSGSYRLGPNQYLNTIDIQQVERIEVIRGAGSVLYGSDALGGVIHIITRTYRREEPDGLLSGSLSARFSSADRGISTRAQLAGGWKSLMWTGGFSGKNFGNLHTGGGKSPVPLSGYGELDGDAKIAWKPSFRQSLTLSLARVRQSDVSRTDVLQTGANLEYCWDPIQRDMVQLTYRLDRVTSFVDWLEVRARYETQMESLTSVAAVSADVRSHYFDRTNTLGTALEMGSRLGSRHLLTFGFDLDRDTMTSSRDDLDRLTGIVLPLPGNVPNGSTYGTSAAFLQDEIKLAGPLAFNIGGRYTRVAIKGRLTDAATGVLQIDNDVRDFTGNAFLSVRASQYVRFLAGFSEAFRAPNLNDEGFLGISGPRFEVPNPALEPEKSGTWEAGVKFGHHRLTGTASYYLSDYRGLIDRAPSTFAGLSFLDSNGNGVKDKGELSVYRRQNIGRARILGGDVEAQWRISGAVSIFSNFSWVRGDDAVNRTPLTRIPPMKGLFGSRWRPSGGLWVEAYTILAGAQRRLSPSDRADPRISPGGTPGFATANLRTGFSAGGLGTVTIGLENLTNKSYRWHGSGIDAPGTNLVLGIMRSIP